MEIVHRIDILIPYGLVALVTLSTLAYLLRVLRYGRKGYERIEQDGAGAFVGKALKELAFWVLEPVAKLAVYLKMTPNTLSYLTLLFGLAAGFMLSVGLFGFAALLILVSSLCDALDGWVARLSNKASFGGAVLDSSVDRYVEFCILGGILVLFCDDHELFVIVLLALIGSFMVSYSTAKAEAMSVSPPRGSMRRSDRAVFLFVGTFCAALFSSSWALVVSTLIIAIFANVSAVQRLMYVAKNAGLKN